MLDENQRLDVLMARLRALPHFQPDREWKDQALRRLLARIDGLAPLLGEANHWAIYATYDPDPVQFANSVRSRGDGWRPLAVDPDHLRTAVTNLQPQLVVIDARLPRAHALARMVQAASFAETAISQAA